MASSTILKVFAFASILFTFILCISLVSIISSFAYETRSQRTIRRATNMCVSCDDLQSFPGFPGVASEGIDRLRSAKNKSSCCSSTDEILKLRIRKMMDEQVYEYNSGLPAEIVTISLGKNNCDLVPLDENMPRAKVVGVVDHDRSSYQSDHWKVRWEKNGNATNGKITHLEEDGEIFIRQPGTYVVLTKLRIHWDASAPLTSDFSHVLYQFSNKYGSETVLMQKRRTLCGSSDGQYDCFMSAVFRFHEYDRISIHTTHAQHLQINETENFFGVFYTYDMY
ncbi:uncharacterized protein LOC128218750 [Mya arenaria]|uniref:uncharacterized protein LOC128218750 n=1 Tax=Mya arenaria TaxID=6604 RepID=UPI0022DF1233|nr:uncharacterized protein LOC128218750 [Mya arenaria]XP_052782399.1 uncharacterized protein LOC128218750 [Mya arenaria]